MDHRQVLAKIIQTQSRKDFDKPYFVCPLDKHGKEILFAILRGCPRIGTEYVVFSDIAWKVEFKEHDKQMWLALTRSSLPREQIWEAKREFEKTAKYVPYNPGPLFEEEDDDQHDPDLMFPWGV